MLLNFAPFNLVEDRSRIVTSQAQQAHNHLANVLEAISELMWSLNFVPLEHLFLIWAQIPLWLNRRWSRAQQSSRAELRTFFLVFDLLAIAKRNFHRQIRHRSISIVGFAINLCIIFGSAPYWNAEANIADFIIQLHNAIMRADWFRDYPRSV